MVKQYATMITAISKRFIKQQYAFYESYVELMRGIMDSISSAYCTGFITFHDQTRLNRLYNIWLEKIKKLDEYYYLY